MWCNRILYKHKSLMKWPFNQACRCVWVHVNEGNTVVHVTPPLLKIMINTVQLDQKFIQKLYIGSILFEGFLVGRSSKPGLGCSIVLLWSWRTRCAPQETSWEGWPLPELPCRPVEQKSAQIQKRRMSLGLWFSHRSCSPAHLCVCVVVCIHAVVLRLSFYLPRFLRGGGGGAGSAARCHWSPITARSS